MTVRRSLEETRELILEAALDLLGRDEIAFDPAAVTLIDACRHAGLRTAGSGYRIWPNQEEFRTDLMRHAVVTRPALAERITRLKGSPNPDLLEKGPTEHIRLVAFENHRAAAGRDELVRRSATWLRAHRDPDVRASHIEIEQDLIAVLAEQYRRILDAYGLQMRPPYRVEHLAFAVEAQTRGLAWMTVFGDDLGLMDLKRPTGPDGQLQRWNLLGCVIEALASAFTEPVTATPDPG